MHDFLFWVFAIATGSCAILVVVTQNIVRAATWLLFSLAGASAIFFLLGADLVGAVQLLVYVGGTLVLVIFGVMLTAQGPFINMKTGSAEWAVSALVGLLLLGVIVLGTRAVSGVNDKAMLQPPKGSVVADFAPKRRLAERRDLLNQYRRDVMLQVKAGELGAGEADKKIKDKEKELINEAPAYSAYSATIGLGFLGTGVGPAHEEPPTPALLRKIRDLQRQFDEGELPKMEFDRRMRDLRKPVRTSYLLPFEIVSVHLLVVLIGAAYLARAKRRRAT